MGYWGEALAYNRPLWEEQDIKSAKHTLSKIVDTSRLSQREKDYINALHLLYGDEQKVFRDKAYSNALRNFMFLTKRQKEIYEFLKEHIQGSLRDKH